MIIKVKTIHVRISQKIRTPSIFGTKTWLLWKRFHCINITLYKYTVPCKYRMKQTVRPIPKILFYLKAIVKKIKIAKFHRTRAPFRKLRCVRNQINWLINEMKYREALSPALKLNNSYMLAYESVNVFGSTWDLYFLEHVCSLTRSRFSIFQFAPRRAELWKENQNRSSFSRNSRNSIYYSRYTVLDALKSEYTESNILYPRAFVKLSLVRIFSLLITFK